MSDAYDREQQNNTRLSELSSKVSALRGVTVDIYDNARSQDVIDNSRSFLLDDDLNQGFRGSTGPNGTEWEQGRDTEAGGDNHWGCGVSVVDFELVLSKTLKVEAVLG
ncbi:hypothetical protein MMC28_002627 [Mycoblastus sanguinarius]|nr:hypothetical protein [Mycoblastus sanguinarius]